MMNRYAAQLFRRDRCSPSWTVTQSRTFKTQGSARRWLERKLAPVECTRFTYHRDRARADFGEIRDRKRQDLLEVIEAEVIVFPSVGELGVSP